MGNLSNLYISKSYQSLIHLETDNTASSTLVGLQDGLGNSIGISVNTSGSLSISGSFTASLANGYAWVGDGNNRTSLVPTSSFGSVTSAITGSSLITASFSGNTLTFTKGNNTTFGVVIPDVSGSGPTNISSLNAFTASQYQINDAIAISTASLNAFTSSQESLNPLFARIDTANVFAEPNTFEGGNVYLNEVTFLNTNNIRPFNAAGANSLVIRNTDINDNNCNLIIQVNGGKTLSVFANSGSNFTGKLSVNGAISASSTLTASLQQGYAWVGGTSGRTTTVPTSSFVSTPTDISALNAFTSSQNTKNSTLATYTGSVDTQFVSVGSSTSSLNSATASLFTSASLALVTASFSGNTLTFTKGDSSTFGVIIPDVSGSTIPAGTISGSSQITALGFVSSSVTGSSLVTGSVVGNVLTFTKGDSTQFSLTVATGSGGGSTDTGSLMVTGSVNVNVLTFTKGDGSTFDLTVAASGSAPAGTVSSSQQILNYNIFATTGSNDFVGTQNFSASVASNNILNIIGGAKMTLGGTTMPYNETAFFSMVGGDGGNNGGALQYQISNGGATFLCGDAPSGSTQSVGNTPISFENKTRSGSISFTNEGNTGQIRLQNNTGSINLAAGSSISISGSSTTIQDVNFIPFSASLDSRILAITGSGGGTTFSKPSVESISGSLLLTANTFNSGSANLLHLTASAQNQANLVFKNNNSTGTTSISGSNNIFTNPATPTTGYTRYIGGSNNLYLNSTNGINSQITQSAASVSGNRPTMNNNIFNSIGNFSINQAVNTGDHSYSQNYISGNGNVTINALSHTGSLSLSHNVLSFGSITINASSASVAQIATGISGSGTINVNGNLIQGNGSMTITSPRFLLPTNTQSSLGNFVAGGSITVTNISSSAAVTANNNFGNSVISYTNAGAAGLGLHTLAGGFSQNVGGATLIASASSMNFNFNTTSGNNLTVTNQAWSGSLGVGQFNILRNIFYGQSGILLITGSVDGTGNTTGAFTDNAVIGKSNTIFSNQSGAGLHNSFISNVVGGENLIISASNSFNSTIGGGAYFGRYNANDGVRNKTGQTVFSVGTGNSTARKTGLLIDSGSNTFIEGTLNVSGSTTLSGSLYIQSGSTLPAATGSSVLTWNSATGQVSQSPIATLISSSFSVGAFNSTITQSGSAAVSQSMTFNNTDISNGITLNGGGTQLTIANSGTYNIQFSAQLLASTGADTIWIWLKKNGTNISNTGTKLVLRNNEADVAAWNFVVPAVATDYFELVWQSLDGHATLLTEVASGNYPAIPSVIVTVTQVE